MSSTSSVPTSGLHLYIDPISQPSRAVHCLLLECKIPFTLHIVQIAKGEHRRPEFLAVNPLGQLPCIVHDGFALGESHTIMKYLSATFKAPGNWYPADVKVRSRINEYLDWHSQHTRKCAQLVFSTVFGPKFGVMTEQQATFAREQALPVVKAVCKRLNKLLEKQQYITPTQQISIADLSAIFELKMLDLINWDWSPYPKLTAYFSRVESELKSFSTVNDKYDQLVAKMKKAQPTKAKL